MKVLFLIHSLALGGAERVTANLANYWAEKGWHVIVATLSTNENDFYTLHPKIERIPLGVARESRNSVSAIANNMRSLRMVRRVLKEKRPEVAIGMMTTANIFLGLTGWRLPVSCFGSERTHPPMVPLGAMWECLRAVSYKKLDAVISLTELSAEWLRRHTSAQYVAVIGNPILWPLPMAQPVRNCGEWIHSKRHALLAAGRLVKEKGFDLLLQAFFRIAPDLPDWDLLIVGEGPQRVGLESQVQKLGLSDRVKMPGQVGNMSDWYDAADIFVMSSRFEGFPNAMGEAMSYGLPAVSFDCPTGPSDIIRNEVDGLLVPHMEVNALAKALARLMRDENLRARMSCRAVEVRERFAVERIAGRWEKLFGELACE